MKEEDKEKSNYEKICEYFSLNALYSKEEIIEGLKELNIAPKGNSLISKLGQEISFRKTRGKQIDESVIMIQFKRNSKHNNLYKLYSWVNYF